MNRLFVVLFTCSMLCVSLGHVAFGKTGKKACPCGETKSATHERMLVKNRSIPWESDMKAAHEIAITDILHWATPNPLPDRSPTSTETLPLERPLRKIIGYILLTKLSPDDCDYHMEVAETNSGHHNRMICEIPNTQEYCSLRAEYMKLLGLRTLDKKITYTRKNARKVIITGYPFFDVSHAGPKHRSGSKDVATSWEIHPVVNIELQE